MLDALVACKKIQTYTEGQTLEMYQADEMRRLAIERLLTILSEAFSRINDVDPSFRDHFPDLGKIIGARNRIIHGYDSVSDVIIWNALKDKIPNLTANLAAWLEENP